MRARSGIGAVVVALVAVVGMFTPSQAADFYQPPQELPERNGQVIRSVESVFYLDPARVLRAPATATRVMYASEGVRDRTAITGTILVPNRNWSGPGPRPVIGYAVGTQGMADTCAPSRQFAAGTEYEGAFIKALLARGYSVAVTDYEGLGTPGTHPYANAPALGRSLLDMVRAAQDLNLADRSAPVLLSGYSEGGGAVAGALEQLADYAPELNVRGAYAGAVPADLARLAPQVDGGPYSGFLLYAVAGLNASYSDMKLAQLLNTWGKQALATAERTCTAEGIARFAFARSQSYTADGESVVSKLDRPDIARVLEGIRVGKGKPPVPILVLHSLADEIVNYGQGRQMARSWCRNGANVTFGTLLTPTHVGGALAGAPRAWNFFEQAIAGDAPEGNCGRF